MQIARTSQNAFRIQANFVSTSYKPQNPPDNNIGKYFRNIIVKLRYSVLTYVHNKHTVQARFSDIKFRVNL